MSRTTETIRFNLNNPKDVQKVRQLIEQRYPLPLPKRGQNPLDIAIHTADTQSLAAAHRLSGNSIYYMAHYMRQVWQLRPKHKLFVGHYLNPETETAILNLRFGCYNQRTWDDNEKKAIQQFFAAMRAYYRIPKLKEKLAVWQPPFACHNSKRPT